MTNSLRNRAEGRSQVLPLAQEYAVVWKDANPNIYTAAPSLVRLPSGRLLCSFALVTRVGRAKGDPERSLKTLFCASDDGGKTWREVGSVGLDDGLAFVSGGRLHLLCNRSGRQDIVLVASDDEGSSWTAPLTLFKGRFWNTFSPHVIRNGNLYWSLGSTNENGNFNRIGSRIVAVTADLSSGDLMNPSIWRMSPYLTYPGTPAGLSAGLEDRIQRDRAHTTTGEVKVEDVPDRGDHWLEPNVIEVNGRLRVYVRLRIDGQMTSHLSAVCDLEDDGERLDLSFSQFHPLPGNCYFHIIRDGPGGYFWATTNLPTRTQDAEWGQEMLAHGLINGTQANERRFLMLMYSLDALNWFPAGCVAKWGSPGQGFHYNALLIDGDDLLISSRTARNAPNQHDNDLVTLHRIRDFRSLALNLHPEL